MLKWESPTILALGRCCVMVKIQEVARPGLPPRKRCQPENLDSAVLAVEEGLVIIDVELHAPAVELDFVNPVWPGRRDFRQRRGHRLNEGNFTQHAADVGTLAGGVQERLIVSSEDRTYH